MENITFKDDQQRNPYEHASTCTTSALFIAAILIIAGAIVSNIGHSRFDDVGFDWAGFGLWVVPAGVTIAIGTCASSVCKQLVDSLTP